jgi:hypothetical protein
MNDAAVRRQDHPLKAGLRWVLIPNRKLPPPVNPALLKHAEERAENAQNRVADRITTFSGSMLFVYIHMLWFGLWIGLGVEKYPFGLLTMIVSLGAVLADHHERGEEDRLPRPGPRARASERPD